MQVRILSRTQHKFIDMLKYPLTADVPEVIVLITDVMPDYMLYMCFSQSYMPRLDGLSESLNKAGAGV